MVKRLCVPASERNTVANNCKLLEPFFMRYLFCTLGLSRFCLNLKSSFTSKRFGLNFLFDFLTQEMVIPSPSPRPQPAIKPVSTCLHRFLTFQLRLQHLAVWRESLCFCCCVCPSSFLYVGFHVSLQAAVLHLQTHWTPQLQGEINLNSTSTDHQSESETDVLV